MKTSDGAEEGKRFSSASDQYQESYFHPLVMSGTVTLAVVSVSLVR